MSTNLKEVAQREPVNLYQKEGQLTLAGEWVDYLLHLNQEVVFRRDTPSVIDPEDAFSLSWVSADELVKFLTKDGENYDSQSPQPFWQTRLANLEKEIDRVGPDNSKLGISLLTLKGFIENQLQTSTDSSTLATAEVRPRDPAIEQMFGNGLKVIEMSENTVKLSPVNPKNVELLSDRATALTRLAECYQDSSMVRVPKPRAISAKQKYIEVQRAPGFQLIKITREQQAALHELPYATRLRLITQFLGGINNLNLKGRVFSDYNPTSFNYDPDNHQLWITDPGANEVRGGEYFNERSSAEASQAEIYEIFRSNQFAEMLETLGLNYKELEKIKSYAADKKLHSVSDIVELISAGS